MIDLAELKSALGACDRHVGDKELRDMVHKRGMDPDNLRMDYDAFVNFMGEPSRISVADLHKYFYALDLDGSGYLTAAELRHVMTNMNLSPDDAVVDEMVAMYDLDGNGQLQVDEFVELIKGLGLAVFDDLEDEPETTKSETDSEDVEEERDETPEMSVACKIDEFPEPLREKIKMFDLEGTGVVTASDLERAAELLKIEKMAGAMDPESNPALHWTKGREKRGLGELIYKANHIALTVEDVGRSAAFYSDVLGFQQIRRPNFDRHGAWFTMGNLELHLIKGTPLVHTGDDLIVGHISIETFGIDKIPGMLRKMGIPFRQNVSVPKGTEGSAQGTNSSKNNKKIVRQYFFRDPDGYYVEVCNCDVLTKYCLGAKADLDSYEEGGKPITVEDAGKLIGIMQRWSSSGVVEKDNREALIHKANATDMSPQAVASLFGCEPADVLDKELLHSLIMRRSIYGDICQNTSEQELKEILLASGNNVPMATKIMKLKADVEGTRRVQAPAFYEDGNVLVKPKEQSMNDDL